MSSQHISELMDGLAPEELGLELEPSPVSAGQVWNALRDRGVVKAAPERSKRRGMRRALVRAAIAAALLLALTVTACAVYERYVEQYVVEPPRASAEEQPGRDSRPRLSLTGYQGTPEYQAFTEWEALQEKWQAEKKEVWRRLGVDDSWHETPDNYYAFYGASTQSQADELDAIMEKYGLEPHEHRSALPRGDQYSMLGLESLCRLLDMEPFIHSDRDAYGGYVYDDGTFKLEASVNGDPQTEEEWDALEKKRFTMFLSVKGSFTDIYAQLPADYEQWSHTVGSHEVTLALSDQGGILLAETPGAYIYLSCRAESREELEAFADTVDFDALAERFDGTPLDLTEGMEEMDEQYKAWEEAWLDAHSADKEDASKPDFADPQAETDYVLDKLGTWTWTDSTPEGYSFGWRTGVYLSGGDDNALIASGYWPADDGESVGISMLYERNFTDSGMTESRNRAELEKYKATCPDGTVFDLAGHEALYLPADSGPQSSLRWLDEERDLLFTVMIQGEQTPLETLRSYAEALISDMNSSTDDING